MAKNDVANRLGMNRRLRAAGRHLSVAAAAIMTVCVTTAPALASDQNGTITNVAYVDNGRRVLFWMTGGRTAKPSCDCCDRWEIYVGDAYGQALMSIIMTAYASGRPVTLGGTGSCPHGAGDTEGVGYIQTN